MKIVFIVNPTAGRGKAEKIWKILNESRKTLFPDSSVLMTEYPGHAREIAGNLKEEHVDAVVSVGGDGTVHEIVNGIATKNITLGIVPAGSGNDLARTLGISKNYEQAFRMISDEKTKLIDLGIIGNRYFINIGGVGFDAEVVADMNNNMKFLTGTAAYIASVMKKLLTFSPISLKITIDNMIIEKKIYICAVANGKYYGGGMMLAPNAIIDDGLFDICVLEDLRKLDFLITFPGVFKGRHINHPKVKIYRGANITIEGPSYLSIHADGEIFGRLPANFKILPQALRVFS